MSKGETGQDRKSPLRAVIPVFLVIILTFSTTAGCIDKGVIDSLAAFVEGDDGPGYVWEPLLEERGNFIIEPNDSGEVDLMSIATKVAENLSNLDPAQAINNMKVIMNEEDISMRKYVFTFYVIEGTRNLNIELIGTFMTSVGDYAESPGYMELTIIDPQDKSETHENVQIQDQQMYIYAQDPIEGEWKLELQGLGLQSPADLIYSGKYDLAVRAEMLKED